MNLWDQDPHYPQGMISSSQTIVIDWLYALAPTQWMDSVDIIVLMFQYNHE